MFYRSVNGSFPAAPLRSSPQSPAPVAGFAAFGTATEGSFFREYQRSFDIRGGGSQGSSELRDAVIGLSQATQALHCSADRAERPCR